MKFLQILQKHKKICLYFLFFAFFISFFPIKAFAQAYGSGSYSGGAYNVGNVPTNTPTPASSSNSNASSNIFSSASAPSCGNTPPGNHPQWLYAATPLNGTSVMVYFTDASNPYDHYTVEYGTSEGNYTFGLDNAGGKGIRSVVINNLLPNTTYYFRVRAGNGCAPGPWSNELSTTTLSLVSINNLAFTSTQVAPAPVTTQENTQQQTQTSCQSYTVKPGDTLYSVSQSLLGDGNKYPEIIDQNKTAYPQLLTSHDLEVGWNLQSCQNTQQNTKQAGVPQQSTTPSGYNVNVIVKDTKNKPVAGATVTLHSTPQKAITNKKGEAIFHNIERGQHQVLIAYNSYQGQENINLEGNVKTFNVAIQVKPVNVLISPFAYVIIGVLVSIIIVLLVLLVIKRRKN